MALRATRRLAEKMSADPWTYHQGDASPFWGRVRKALVVNPDSHTGLIGTPEYRYPPPASRPEPYHRPAGKASDIAENPYFQRDPRRNFPQTSVVTQQKLSALLIAQPEGLALPPIAASASSAPADARALTTSETAPSLSSLYASEGGSSSSALPPLAVPTAGDYVPRKVVLTPSAPHLQLPGNRKTSYIPVVNFTA